MSSPIEVYEQNCLMEPGTQQVNNLAGMPGLYKTIPLHTMKCSHPQCPRLAQFDVIHDMQHHYFCPDHTKY
jgi:hypothetical protein